jgi:hypothetical protein
VKKRKGSVSIDVVIVKKVGSDYILTSLDESVDFALRVTTDNASAHSMIARKFKANDRKHARTFKALNKVALIVKKDGVHLGSPESWFNTLIRFDQSTVAAAVLQQALDAT